MECDVPRKELRPPGSSPVWLSISGLGFRVFIWPFVWAILPGPPFRLAISIRRIGEPKWRAREPRWKAKTTFRTKMESRKAEMETLVRVAPHCTQPRAAKKKMVQQTLHFSPSCQISSRSQGLFSHSGPPSLANATYFGSPCLRLFRFS